MARAATNETPPMTLPSSVGTQQSQRHYGGSVHSVKAHHGVEAAIIAACSI
jgi:hypothetical protein